MNEESEVFCFKETIERLPAKYWELQGTTKAWTPSFVLRFQRDPSTVVLVSHSKISTSKDTGLRETSDKSNHGLVQVEPRKPRSKRSR